MLKTIEISVSDADIVLKTNGINRCGPDEAKTVKRPLRRVFKDVAGNAGNAASDTLDACNGATAQALDVSSLDGESIVLTVGQTSLRVRSVVEISSSS